jgi:hypothetical protein
MVVAFVVICGHNKDMEKKQTPLDTFFAVRMANGTKVHLKYSGSSQTECSVWVHNSRQYKTEETVVTCSKCWKKANLMKDRAEKIAALGFTNEKKEG